MMAVRAPPVLNVYDISGYTFNFSFHNLQKHSFLCERKASLRHKYKTSGRVTSVHGILVMTVHKHPAILLMKRIGPRFYKLPGGRLKAGENEGEGLRRKLSSKLSYETLPYQKIDWQVGDCVAIWWRPNFDDQIYPYCPAHITRPKECIKLFVVQLPESSLFMVPNDYTLVLVPLFELYDNDMKYGTVLANLPVNVSIVEFRKIQIQHPGQEKAKGDQITQGPLLSNCSVRCSSSFMIFYEIVGKFQRKISSFIQ